MSRFVPALFLLLACWCAAASAQPLELPLACAPECVVQTYMDADPAAGTARDYACGTLTSDGHTGTDFRILWEEMEQGKAVLAVAPGVVKSVRNDMPDGAYIRQGMDAVRGRECGNGLVVEHAGGLVSQYCHLRQGSVRVARGNAVEAGTPLGLVGVSGLSDYSHLHLSLRRDGAPIDPFTGSRARGCTRSKDFLWSERAASLVPYRPGGILRTGFCAQVPAKDEVARGNAPKQSITPQSSPFVFYGLAYGVRAGDRATLAITAPGGNLLAKSVDRINRNQAQRLSYVGRRRGDRPWPQGTYVGRYALTRETDGVWRVVDEEERRITLPEP